MFLTGVIFYFSIIIVTILLGADLRLFIDLPSFIFVLLSNIAILITTNSVNSFFYGIKIVTLKNIEVNSEKIRESIEIFSLLNKSSWSISILGVVIGLISMLSRLDEPSSLGVYMSILLLIPFYSVMLNAIIIGPARSALTKMQGKLKLSETDN